MNEQERKLRTRMAEAHTEARGILDADASKPLSAEDEQRVGALYDEYDRIGKTLEAMDRSALAEKDLSRSLSDPTRPEADPKPDAKRAKRTVATREYREHFNQYLSSGVQDRALQMDSDTTGGFVVAPEIFSDQIIKAVDNQVFIRQLARKAKSLFRLPNGASLGVPQLVADPDDADWTSELATGGEDSAMTFGKREFRPQPLAKLIRISNKLIRAAGQLTQFSEDGETESPMSVDELVNDRLAYKFAVAEEKAYMVGTGFLQPLGVFTASADGIPTTSDVIAAGTTALVADDLINTKYSLKAQYLQSPNTAWVAPRRHQGDPQVQGHQRPVPVGAGRDRPGQPHRRPARHDPRSALLHVRVRAEHVHRRPVRRDPRRLALLLDRRCPRLHGPAPGRAVRPQQPDRLHRPQGDRWHAGPGRGVRPRPAPRLTPNRTHRRTAA